MRVREKHTPTHPVLIWLWHSLGPPLSVTLLTTVALAPRAIGEPVPVTALLPLLALHWWTGATRPGLIALLAVMAGLVMDVLSHGPLGYWAIIDLAAVALADLSRTQLARGLFVHSGVVMLHLGALVALQWGLIFACTLAPPDIVPLARQALGAALLYPVLALALSLTAPGPASCHWGRV